MSEHDVIVIGAGPAGEVCAGSLAREGLDVALVERELIGGECAFWACMPSKALLRPAEALTEARRVPGAREAASGELSVAAVLARRDEVIHGLDDSVQLPWVTDRGITLVRGAARIDGERCVRVGGDLLQARRAVVIAVGSGAAVPPVDGLSELSPWTNRQATTAESAPARLAVLGGGAVGCELAQAWASLGSRVNLVEAMPGLLPGEEPLAGAELERSLRDRGIDVRTGGEVTRVRRHADTGVFTLTLSDGAEIASDELLVAVGRRPRTGDLGLESVGLTPGETISVEDDMRVSAPRNGDRSPAAPAPLDWLFAIGDVNGRALLTHAGKYQALVAAATIMNRPARAAWDGRLAPRVVFTEPQVAAVGRTLQQALDDGIPARAVDAEIAKTPGASFIGKGAPAPARIVVDEQREVVIGATLCGPDVADMLHAATVAIVGEIPLRRLAGAMPAFPTRSEVWLTLLESWKP